MSATDGQRIIGYKTAHLLIRFLSVAAFQADGGLRQQPLAGSGSGHRAAAQDVVGGIGYMPERVRSLPSIWKMGPTSATLGWFKSPLDNLKL